MWDWVKRSINTASAWVSAFAANASGVYNIVKFARTFANVENGSPVEIGITAASAGVSLLPCIMQANSYDEMMAKLHNNTPCCNSCGSASCCCQTIPSKIYAALVKTIQSGASLSLILTRLIGLPAGFALTGVLSAAYMVSQYFVANYGNKKQDAEPTVEARANYSNIVATLLKVLAALGCVSGVATSTLGITTISEMIHKQKITVSPDHTTIDVQLTDLFALIGALIPIILQGKAYYALASNALSSTNNININAENENFPQNATEKETILWQQISTIYSAMYKSLGSQTGPVTLSNILLTELVGLSVLPSAGISIAIGGLLFLLMSWQQYGYINVEQTHSNVAVNNANEDKPSFWQRIKNCCAKSKEQYGEEQPLVTNTIRV